MTFPQVPRDLSVEMYLGGTWTDVTSDVRNDPGIEITRGRPNEASAPQHSRCLLTLDNRAGNYAPRNPLGAWYGELGRNTPLRVSVNLSEDTFTRTMSPGWGTNDTGHPYSNVVGSGGTVATSDAAVASDVGTLSVPAANGYRFMYLNTVTFRDVDVAVTTTLPITNIIGGPVDTNILLRIQSTDIYYLAKVSISTTEAITIQLRYRDATSAFTDLTVATATGLTHSSGQALRIRAQAEGQTLRAKVWAASGDEPYGWQVSAQSLSITSPGWVGVRDSVATGNTNTLPLVFSHDNLVVRSARFTGEVAAWHQERDTSGTDITAPIEAASVLRRLGQGTAPQLSTLYRGITGLTTPAVAYWPCEEGSDATTIASAIGGPPMTLTGETDFASYSGIVSSYPLPVIGIGSWFGLVPNYTSTGQVQLRFIMHTPASEIPDNEVLIDIGTAGGYKWEIKYKTGGSLKLELWQDLTNIFFTVPITYAITDKDIMVVLDLEQSGADINWTLTTLEEGADISQFFTGTQAGHTLGRATRVFVAPYATASGTAFGHITVRKETASVWDLEAELNGFAGETALNRMARLCEQNEIAFAYDRGNVLSAAMGPQRPLTLTTLLQECADADRGTLYDSRGELGIRYRTRGSLYNQVAVALLNYTGGNIAPPFLPVDDDQLTRNDVTATRVNGGSARVVLETGRMSVLEPAEGGVGRYDTSITVNVYTDNQLADIAGWAVYQGTVDEARYPRVVVNLAAAGVAGDEDLTLDLLDLDVDDLFQIFNPPAGHSSFALSQLARGYTETLAAFEHTLTVNAASATPHTTLQIGSGSLDWSVHKLDTDGCTLVSSITTTATSFMVAVPSGTLWTTDPAEMPLAVVIGGEMMYVDVVTGTSSPQTFSSVTRSVNNIVKAHDAGSVVALAQQSILAL